MFLGDFPHTLDDKGRLIMPSKFRNELGTNFIVTRGLEGCLFVFTESKWNEFTEQLNSKGLSKKDVRSITRFFCSCAMTSDLDKQGRFLLVNTLREYAEITKEVIIIGVGTRLEIWNKDKWKKYNSNENISADTIAENMTMLGI